MSKLYFKKLDNELPTPQFMTEGSVGLDTFVRKDMTIPPNNWALIPLGLVAKAPEGTFIALLPRSSTFRKTGLLLANSMGVIDQDYCGDSDEIMAFVYNALDTAIDIKRGDRLFQLLFINIEVPELIEVTEGSLTDKSRGGFGSTDKQ
jgi:dUTP pyrophosphatase